MGLDNLLLSRIQFAFTIDYHILWPAWTIGISGFIVVLNMLWFRTRRPVYRDLLRFWIHLFALGFAMGVVPGIGLSYEIGTNWSVFANSRPTKSSCASIRYWARSIHNSGTRRPPRSSRSWRRSPWPRSTTERW
jgi:hypothetical protein